LDLTAGTDTYKIPILMRTLGSMFEEAEMDPERLSQYDGYQKFINRLRLEMKLFSHSLEQPPQETVIAAMQVLARFEPGTFQHEIELLLTAQKDKATQTKASPKVVMAALEIMHSGDFDFASHENETLSILAVLSGRQHTSSSNQTNPNFLYNPSNRIAMARTAHSYGKTDLAVEILQSLTEHLIQIIGFATQEASVEKFYNPFQETIKLLAEISSPQAAIDIITDHLMNQQTCLSSAKELIFKALAKNLPAEVVGKKMVTSYKRHGFISWHKLININSYNPNNIILMSHLREYSDICRVILNEMS
jgi:hypothetical protein